MGLVPIQKRPQSPPLPLLPREDTGEKTAVYEPGPHQT